MYVPNLENWLNQYTLANFRFVCVDINVFFSKITIFYRKFEKIKAAKLCKWYESQMKNRIESDQDLKEKDLTKVGYNVSVLNMGQLFCESLLGIEWFQYIKK